MPYPPEFYEQRLAASRDPRSAVWDGTKEQWERVRQETEVICRRYVLPGNRVLDAGCGIGELVECLPADVDYTGIDYCCGFIEAARKRYPTRRFEVVDLLQLDAWEAGPFDLVICRTVEGVVGEGAWPGVMEALLRKAPRVLVFRAMLVEGETLKTVQIVERRMEK